MEWRDEGVVLSVRRHGEQAAILEAFTPGYGRHLGLVPGGGGRRLAPVMQPGSTLDLTWRARLDDQLGTFRVEPRVSRAGLLGDRLALAGMTSLLSLLAFTLPERAPHPGLYHPSVAVLDMIGASDAWPLAYLRWEVALLADMGFALDLSRCAVTGATDGLAYVSPKSGRAVSRAGAGAWADRLLPFTPALTGESAAAPDVAGGLVTTGHFLEAWLAADLGARALPEARRRFVVAYGRATGRNTSSSPPASDSTSRRP